MQDFLTITPTEIADLCRRRHVRRLSIFGSAVREDFDPAHSDLDVIVEFEDFPLDQYLDNKRALQDELTAAFGRDIDLLTWNSLKNPVIRQEVESSHLMLYAA
jgi:predicted nucleotidyltransferase